MISPIHRSPRFFARFGGVIYLVIIAAGLFAEVFARGPLIAAADAVATARNIAANGFLLRMSIVADLSTYLLAIPLTLILYRLLEPVNRDLALLAVLLNLAQDAVGALNAISTYQPLQLLGGAKYLAAFSQDQLNAMTLLAMRGHSIGFAAALTFFGASCIVLGRLIAKSGFLPRSLGWMIGVAGLCYLVNSVAVFLSPAIASMLFPAILAPAFIGELALALWLAIKGVDEGRWLTISSRYSLPST
jgi:hypothetical protein